MSATDKSRGNWLRYVPPVAALGTAFVLQVILVTDLLGGAIANQIHSHWGYAAGVLFGLSVASCAEGGAAYLMELYDKHLLARDSVWLLRLAMVAYVAASGLAIHWWTEHRGLPSVISWILAGMSASALFLWSRGARWRNRQKMLAAEQIDPALPRLPMAAKVLHPVRWLVSLWLVAWTPAATTDQVRQRYEQWSADRSWRRAYRSAGQTGDLYVANQVVSAMVVASAEQAIGVQVVAEQVAATMLEEARGLADAILDGARRELDDQRATMRRDQERANTLALQATTQERHADDVLQDARAKAEALVSGAAQRADEMVDAARAQAAEVVAEAVRRAEKIAADIQLPKRQADSSKPVRRTGGVQVSAGRLLPSVEDLTDTLAERFKDKQTPGRPKATEVLREVYGSCSPDRARQAIDLLRVRRGEQPADSEQERLQEPQQTTNGHKPELIGVPS